MDNTKEYILCASIWYKEFPLVKDFEDYLIRPTNVDRGAVISGYRHPHCLYLANAMTGKRNCELGESIQGFLTSQNRFVDRKEGAKIALASGQITKLNFNSKDLFSEDLYKIKTP